jgi:tetratricopeptide (TPR) repeat protein
MFQWASATADSVSVMPPFTRNSREHIAETMPRPLLLDQVVSAMNHGHPISLYGLGGSGKTQLTLSVAEWFIDRNPGSSVLWVNAASIETCSTGLDTILAACGIRAESKFICFMSLKAWLEDFSHGRWLMVFDDARMETVEVFIPYLPSCTHGQVIFTSDTQAVANQLADGGASIEIGSFEFAEAEALVVATLREDLLGADEKISIKRIIQRLDALPLAITQTVAFMNANMLSPTAYLIEMENDEKLSEFIAFSQNSTSKTPESPMTKIKTLDTVWRLSFDKLQLKTPVGVEILAVASFVEAQDIPIDLITSTIPENTSLAIMDAIKELRNYSFITKASSIDMFSTNSIVQLGVQRWLKENKQYWAEKVLLTISKGFPDAEDSGTWKQCRVLLPHALKVLGSSVTGVNGPELSNAITILRMKIGIYNFHKGDYSSAQQNLQIALASPENNQDLVETWSLRAQEALILTHREQGRNVLAHEMALKLKHSNKVRYGRKSRHTAEAYRLLSLIYQQDGKYQDSLKAAQKALDCAKAVDKKENPRSLIILRCQRRVGTLYELLCKFSEAEDALTGAALGYKARGEDKSNDALGVQYRLSWMQRAAGYYEDSAVTARECYKDYVKLLGPHHPRTLKTLYSLAVTKQSQELWEEAAGDLEAILEQCNQRPGFGPGHHYTHTLCFNLAQVYEGMGSSRYAEARDMYVLALKGQKSNLAPDHLDLLLSQAELIRIEWKLNPQDHVMAEDRCQDLLKRVKKESGGELRTKWSLMSTLAEINAYKADPTVLPSSSTSNQLDQPCLNDSNKNAQACWKEAGSWQTKVLKSKTKILGVRHPETKRSATICAKYLKEAENSKSSTVRTKYTVSDDSARDETDSVSQGDTISTGMEVRFISRQ